MSDDELIEYLGETYGASVELLNHPEMRPLFLPMVRADALMTQNYRYTPGPPLAYDITATAGFQDPYVDEHYLEGWRHHTRGTVNTRLYPGDHFFFQDSAPRLLADFASELEPRLSSPGRET